MNATVRKRWGWPALWLAVACGLYAVAEMVPGRLLEADEIFYKAAGRNWALTGHFAAPEITGALAKGPLLSHVFLAQPPLYPFLYGLWVRGVGFGPRSNILFDVLIHILLAWTVAAAAQTIFKLPWAVAALTGGLVLPLGGSGRSDELGMILVLGAAMALLRLRERAATWAGGVLLGLGLGASLSAVACLGPLVYWEWYRQRGAAVWRRGALTVTGLGLAVFGLCLSPILATEPSAWRQLTDNAVNSIPWVYGRTHGGGGFWAATWSGVVMFRYDIPTAMGLVMLGVLLFGLVAWRVERQRRVAPYVPFLWGGSVALAIVLFFSTQVPYFWYLAAWALLAAVALAWRLGHRGLTTLGVSLWLIAAAPFLRRTLILWTLPADQRMTANMERVRREIPPGVVVVTTEFWPALADRDCVYAPAAFDEAGRPDANQIAYLIMTGTGSGQPGVPQTADAGPIRPGAEVVDDQLNRVANHLGRLPLARSGDGFGPYILKYPQPVPATAPCPR